MVPVTRELAEAVRNRGNVFVREMPRISAHFDNGVNAGMVELVGYDYDRRCALVAVEGRRSQHADGWHRVRLSDLMLDDRVAAHLQKALLVMGGPGVTGRYSQGTQHFRGRTLR